MTTMQTATQAEPLAGPASDAPGEIVLRRRIFLALNVVTIFALIVGMLAIMAHGGIMAGEWVMLVAFAVTLPWLSIGFWNGVIGFLLDWRHGDGAAAHVAPALSRITGDEPITARVAIVMPLRNEDPDQALTRLATLMRGLARTPWAGRFDVHVLSDTDREDVALREEEGIARWRRNAPGTAIYYRRREVNTGYKAGNIAEFTTRCHGGYDFFLPLDADSVMGPEAVLRLVRVMQASPELGMLQSLVTGLPSRTFFTRAFQFGMRHGMRSYTLGSAWWQADCGPNWGHNVLIRMRPFHEQCAMPYLPGKGPLSGHILSHDQLEAALMRKAGYEVRVIAEEIESHEENPPSLADFIRRDLRWCNGNMQYLRLTRMPGLRPVSRVQLFLAIQMYLGAPAWMLFILIGAGLAAVPGQFEGLPVSVGLGFFALLMTLNLMPKLMGLAQVLVSAERSARYGGRGRVALGGLVEIAFSMLIAPAVALALTRFMLGLAFGRRIGWEAQQRSRERLLWSEAARVLWPQTMVGLALAAWLVTAAPWALVFALPILASLVGAIPLAVLTTLPSLGAWSRSVGLFDIPEDRIGRHEGPVPALSADVA